MYVWTGCDQVKNVTCHFLPLNPGGQQQHHYVISPVCENIIDETTWLPTTAATASSPTIIRDHQGTETITTTRTATRRNPKTKSTPEH
jgi:hypothetical protein